MKRNILSIDEELCNGCGACVESCEEGALQIIDGKAQIVSGLYVGHFSKCPIGAITTEERETEPYSEIAIMEKISQKGEKMILAHLKYLEQHNETEYLRQGLEYIKQHNLNVDVSSLPPQTLTVGRRCPGCPGWNGLCIC